MQPSGRIVFMCQKSRCQHFLNLAKQKVFVNRMFLSTTTYRRKQSALFTKRESKIDQTLIPVELDLDIKEKLEDKNRLMSELTARNICGIDIHQLEKDYHRSHELVAGKKDLEEKRDTLVEQLKSLQNNQKENPTCFSADDEEKLKSLRQQFQETKSLIKEISADFSDTEERLILTGLSLPNRLHPDTVEASFDGGWQKRGSGWNYNSNTGHATFIGKETGKVLSFDVRSKVCKTCEYHQSRKETAPEHDCSLNWHGSSKAMEADMAVSMAHQLKDDHCEIKVVHADNDAATSARLEMEFQDIQKKDDQNHVKKGISTNLHTISKRYKELQKDTTRNYILRCIMYAITSGNDEEEIKVNLERIVPHVFGKHDLCENADWCSFHEDPEKFVFKSLPNGKPLQSEELRSELDSLVQRLVSRSDSITDLGSTQANESFNQLVSVKAPKSRHYGGSCSLQNRVSAAVLQKNEGYGYLSKPLENDRVEVQNGPELEPSASHIDIGQQYNLLKLSNISDKAYYFHDSLALLEQALISYFSDKFRHDGYIQLASPEFFKQLTVEGCGIDWEQLLALESKSSKETANYLVGSSIMSFIAYLAKSTLTLTEDPSQYFTCGRYYRLATEKDHPGLFDATQTVRLNTMSVCQTPEMCYEVLKYETDRLWQIYNKFDIPCRIITKAAPSLHHSEELRTEILLWARSIQQYIKVASSSLVSDYISRRLMIRHNNGKDNANMVYTEALDVTRLVAIILEYGNIQENTYQLPDFEFLIKWHIQKEVNTH